VSESSLRERIAEYKAWAAHWDAPRPLADEHDPYRCPDCDSQMRRDPWRCPTCGPRSPKYVREPYSSNLSRALRAEEDEWESDRDWTGLLDDLIVAYESVSSGRGE
jgi:hypothetical protein